MNRWTTVLIYGVLPLAVGLWVVTWIPSRDVLPAGVAMAVGALVLGGEGGMVGWLSRRRWPGILGDYEGAWTLLLVSLLSASGLFAAILSRYLGAPVGFAQGLLGAGILGVIGLGLRGSPTAPPPGSGTGATRNR